MPFAITHEHTSVSFVLLNESTEGQIMTLGSCMGIVNLLSIGW
jgi:hypothetical protein